MKVLLLLLAACLAHLAGPGATQASTALTQEAHEPAARAEFDHEHALFTGVLRRHVRGDRFDYLALKKDRADFDRYVRGLEAVTPEELGEWTRARRFAFWINAYNAYTIQRVVDAYPVASIRDIGSEEQPVWDQRFIPLGGLEPSVKGDRLSLNQIEHEILRPGFQDPRVHAAVNCASRGCPPLASEAFAAARLESQLDTVVRGWLADPKRNRFERASKTLRVSKVFEWFRDDWKEHGGLRTWIARYAPEEQAGWIRSTTDVRIEFLEYSWKLNDVERAR